MTAVKIPLTDTERDVLARGLTEWGGPARCTTALAVAMGFGGVDAVAVEGRRIGADIRAGRGLSRADWWRALVATEIAFASDVFGSGVGWPTTTGLNDDVTIRILRSLQRKLAASANVHDA